MLPFNKGQHLVNRSPLDDETLLAGSGAGSRVFPAVARKSFHRAAEITGTGKSAMNRQVRRLQDVMGLQLVVSRRAAILTSSRNRFHR